jgi:hypothetical protein
MNYEIVVVRAFEVHCSCFIADDSPEVKNKEGKHLGRKGLRLQIVRKWSEQ